MSSKKFALYAKKNLAPMMTIKNTIKFENTVKHRKVHNCFSANRERT